MSELQLRQPNLDIQDLSMPAEEMYSINQLDSKRFSDMDDNALVEALIQAEIHDDETLKGVISDDLLDRLAELERHDKGIANQVLDSIIKEIDKRKESSNQEQDGQDDAPKSEWTPIKGTNPDVEVKVEGVFEPQNSVEWKRDQEDDDISEDDTQEIPVVAPRNKRGLFARMRDVFKKPPAVRFDGKNYKGEKVTGKRVGDAIVDTRDRKYEGKHYATVVAIGAGAVAAAYLMSKVGHHNIDPALLRDAINAKLGSDAQTASELVGSGPKNLGHTAETARNSTEFLRSGDTIWTHVSHQLGPDATNEDILKATKKVLDLNNLSWDEAKHLPSGYKFLMPNKF